MSISAGALQVSWRLTHLQGSRFQEVLKKEFQVLVCSLEYVDIPSNRNCEFVPNFSACLICIKFVYYILPVP